MFKENYIGFTFDVCISLIISSFHLNEKFSSIESKNGDYFQKKTVNKRNHHKKALVYFFLLSFRCIKKEKLQSHPKKI
jgi:hypothetical protein